MIVLGIETSCDETAVAIIKYMDKNPVPEILSNVVWSQIKLHSAYGGVVPELAARAHVDALDGLIEQALLEANLQLSDIDLFAATAGPGLVGGLMVGLLSVKALAFACDKPFIAVNHLEGHALSVKLTKDVSFPYLLLLVSGGHTQIVLVESIKDYKRIGTTIDDALGEAFDKTAKLLGLPYPGGPSLEARAKFGDANRIKLPQPLKGSGSVDFSFSGLKTAVRQAVIKLQPLNEQDINDLCASFQFTVGEILKERLQCAINNIADLVQLKHRRLPFVVAGGVAANQYIRDILLELAVANNLEFMAPDKRFCTDNAAMIALVGAEYYLTGHEDELNIAPKARWPLDKLSLPKIGAGKKGAKA